jgi:hypothetical protein
MRITSAAVLTLALALTLSAAEPPAGSWKLTLPIDRGEDVIFLLSFAEKDGKWTGEFLDCTAELKVRPKLTLVAIDGDRVRFTLGIEGRDLANFDGVVSKDRQRIGGSVVVLGGPLQLTELRPSKLKKLDDAFELARESVQQAEDGSTLFEVGYDVLEQAAAKKLPADEAKRIVDRLTAAAPKYGPRWERTVALKLTAVLARQEGFAELALAEARRAEQLLTDADDAGTRIGVFGAIASGLLKTGKADEAKPYLARVAEAEAKDYAEYAKAHPPFKTEPFAGRKGKSDRAVLVELFTGAECPPCAAADYALDGLMKTYKPTEVICLQYHCHIPAPDPLTSPDGEDRLGYYQDQISGAPTVFIAGKVGPPGGGPAAAAEKKYQSYRPLIEAALEKPAGVKLELGAAKKGARYELQAHVSDLEKPGPKVMLRFVLAEERVRYAGGNGVRYHHLVVRAMPGGEKGFPLTEKAHEKTVSFTPEELRAELTKYLNRIAKREGDFPRPDRPLALRNLKAVALVQNDETKEVLQAVMIDLGE